jgi:UDP-N-acetylglucosamine--N-acetylmuramyl-(pentapeptide) pyrophosphoryl-undecaprenol N-acetylglucosamine transferase
MTIGTRSCRYLIMAGGTGGHIFPALAVAEKLRECGAQIHWLGTRSGMEFTLIPKQNIPLHLVTVKGFRGKGLLKKLISPFLLIKAIAEAVFIIRKVAPDAVIGFGGYVAAPGGIAAFILGKALIIHEQNSVAGSTNKLLSLFATKKLEAFEGSLKGAILVGNPVRKSVVDLFVNADNKMADVSHETNELADLQDNNHSQEIQNLLIMGGSLGALAINNVLPHAINSLPKEMNVNIWHQTGKGKSLLVSKAYKDLKIDACVDEFIEDVTVAYRWADLIICRAGALTVSEVAIAAVPAIFIPYPYAIDNHQYLNAQWLVKNNAAEMIEQKKLDALSLSSMLTDLLSDTQKLRNYSQALKKLSMPNSALKVASICEKICLDKVTIKENKNAN